MPECFIFNPTPSDQQARIDKLAELCHAAGLTYGEHHECTKYARLCEVIRSAQDAHIILFLHQRDIRDKSPANLSIDIAPWPEDVFAVVYSGGGVKDQVSGTSLPDPPEKRIKYLETHFPTSVTKTSDRFKLLVKAIRAAADRDFDGFTEVDINGTIMPRIVKVWADVDLILEAGLKLGHIPEAASEHVREALKGEPMQYDQLAKQYFAELDPDKKIEIRNLLCPKSKQPSSFLRIHVALTEGMELPRDLHQDPEKLQDARDEFAKVWTLCK